MQIDSLIVGEIQVILNSTVDYSNRNPAEPILVFDIARITRADLMRVHVDPVSLDMNPMLTRAMDGIRCLAKVGLAFSELNPIAKTVMSLIDLSITQLDTLVKRNESVLLPRGCRI
ncbi:hypothetical protein H0H92_015057 [Tricholoma furcatifolium]|nr:hypothetical protein H0H92_015057 [Tricholoma furcatifolium]